MDTCMTCASAPGVFRSRHLLVPDIESTGGWSPCALAGVDLPHRSLLRACSDPLEGADRFERPGGGRHVTAALTLLRRERGARRFLLAHTQSSLGTGAAYVALLVLAFDRFHSPG